MNKSWLLEYPEGAAHDIHLKPSENLVTLFEESCRQYPEHRAATCQGETLTYQQLEKAANEFSAYLQHVLKLQPGDRVAIMLPNLLQYPVTLFGILKAGCVVMNLNPLEKSRSLLHELSESGAKAIVVSENFVSELRQVIDATAIEKIVITSVGALYAPWKRWLVNFVIRHIKKMVPAWHHPKSIRFRKALQQGAKHPFGSPVIDPEDIAFLQYTGGTTGLAKGVSLTHRNMLSNAHQCATWIKPYLTHSPEAVITALPLYHVFALMANCLTFVLIGGEMILIPNPRDIDGLVKTMKKTRFTGLTAVNTLFNALLHHRDFANCDFSQLSIVLGGGMAIQKTVADRFEAVTGRIIAQGYGLTEASPVLTINRFDRPFNGSIGLPVASTEISIQDENGQLLPPNQSGEICARGPQVMKGYWKDPAKTEQVLSKEGWLHTGDIGTMDEQGYVYLIDRLKDMIVVSGFKVFSIEVEETLSQLKGVKESAVIGIPDPEHGEIVKAFVVKEAGALLTESEIIASCHERLLAYKCPRVVEFRTELPKSTVGKILKKQLRDSALKEKPHVA